MPTDVLGQALLTIARNAIGERFGVDPHGVAPFSRLDEPGASFVTLTRHGALRGCIGCLEAHRALGCRGVSRADFRFDPSREELVLLEVNTQPGMTPTSLVPDLAAHDGMSFGELVEWMVEDASCGR